MYVTSSATPPPGAPLHFDEEVDNSSDDVENYLAAKPKKISAYDRLPEEWKIYVHRTQNKFFKLVGTNYCRSWGVFEAIRDIMQNAMDSMSEAHRKNHRGCNCWITVLSPPSQWKGDKKMFQKLYITDETGRRTEPPAGYICWDPEGKNGKPLLTIINRDASFGTDALTIGSSTKDSNNAGGHGEGLKAIAAVAGRSNLKFEIHQNNIATCFQRVIDNNSGKTLDNIVHMSRLAGCKIVHFLPETRTYSKQLKVSPKRDVIVHLGDGEELKFDCLQKAADCFLSFTHRRVPEIPQSEQQLDAFKPVLVRETPAKRSLLLSNDLAGKVYVMGILFETQVKGQRHWGVNLSKSDAPNRDRCVVNTSHYTAAVAKLVSDFIDRDETFAENILEEFSLKEDSDVQHLTKLPLFSSAKAKQALIQAYKRIPENANVRYIVPGNAGANQTHHEVVPRWCDIRACRIVHPLLYDLMKEGFPTTEIIQKECLENLLKAPLWNEQTESLQAWIIQNHRFLLSKKDQQIDEKIYLQIEVRNTGDSFDVPYYVVTDSTQGRVPRRLIFSNRALKLWEEKLDLEFLKLLMEGFQAMTAQPDALKTSNIKKPSEGAVGSKRKLPSDFDPMAPSANIIVHDDDCEVEEDLLSELRFKNEIIRCTPELRTEWERVASRGDKLSQLTELAIKMCRFALADLASGSECPLEFYVSNSNVEGYSNRKGVHINLAHVLGSALSDKIPTLNAMSAHYAVLVAHEYAHYLKLSDRHSMHHAGRTEVNLKKLWHDWPKDLE